MDRVLIVDDDRGVLEFLKLCLTGLNVLTAETGAAALALVEQHAPDVVVLDLRLLDMCGLEVLRRVRQLFPLMPVIIISGFGTPEVEMTAAALGAVEFLHKPFEAKELRHLMDKALAGQHCPPLPLSTAGQEAPAERDGLVGKSAVMRAVYKDIGRAAPLKVSVLVLGETGTGKELVARAVHRHSPRHAGSFLAVNCASVSETLLESELFGHEKGAFTGADRRHVGKFEDANGGTIFLDEIGELRPAAQAKLLRVLEDHSFQRLGGNETLRVDVRVIAATNQDLKKLMPAGRFRPDLFYRLSGFCIRLPPLRDRPGDIHLLAEHFVKLSCREPGQSVSFVDPEVYRLLEAHLWPGNVRELHNAVEYGVAQASTGAFTVDCLPDELRDGQTPGVSVPDLAPHVYRLMQSGCCNILQALEQAGIEAMLHIVSGNKCQAAKALGMSRTTLKKKLRMAINDASHVTTCPETGQ